MNNLILHCEDINKRIGKKEILKDINLNIYEKDIFGFIGPNGAGKTTLIKLVLSLQKIDNGLITINGYNIKSSFKEAMKYVGAIVETPDFYMYLTGYENLKLKARVYNISNERINEVVKLVGLKDRINDKVLKYSLGMRQRLGIAQAILNNPKLLILDEPTNGLDPKGIKFLKDIIKKLSNEGMAILISSHILSELDGLCNKICIIKDGKIIDNSEIEVLRHNKDTSFIFEVSDIQNINLLFRHEIISNNKFRVWCNKEFIPIIIESLSKSNINIYSVNEEIKSLEEIFLNKSGGNNID